MKTRSLDVLVEASVTASVNGIALQRPMEVLPPEVVRQRACLELLRQQAQAEGLLDVNDGPGPETGLSEAASVAIEALLERAIKPSPPGEDACRRYLAAHARNFHPDERLHVRHILFAVTAGMDVAALRNRAHACLLDVRCHDGGGGDKFAQSAEHLSNCPSGAEGGDLGWLRREDCAPEFAQAVFGQSGLGVLTDLVHTRFGLHIVEVLAREAGTDPSFEAVRGAVEGVLSQRAYVMALQEYLAALASHSQILGVDLEARGGTAP